MKRGCFLTVIIFFTITVATVYYVVTHYGDDLFNYGKEYVVESAKKEFEKKIESVDPGPKVDSLKTMVKEYIANIDLKNIDLGQAERFSTEINNILNDGVIETAELTRIKELIKDQINERTTQN